MHRCRGLLAALGLLLLAASCGKSPAQADADVAAAKDALAHRTQDSEEVSEFQPPIEIVDANEYWDGGTTFVALRDSRGRKLVFCVSQAPFESTIPANTLFINAMHPDAETARLPLSEREAKLVAASLRMAVEAAASKDEIEMFAGMGDPAENKMSEPYTVPPDKRWPDKKWFAFYASDALRRLESRDSFDVLSADNDSAPTWHSKYVDEIAAKRAEVARRRKAEELFESFYPEEARVFFHGENLEATYAVKPQTLESEDEAGNLVDDLEHMLGERLARSVGDPVNLAVISCQALGTLTRGWSGTDNKDRIAIHAAKTVEPDAFLAALQRIEHDESALLGAARMFFAEGYGASMAKEARSKWSVRLAEAVLASSLDDEKTNVLMSLSSAKDVSVDNLYWRVARGELGAEKPQTDSWKEEPGIRATSYLQLALRGNAEVTPVAQSLLENARGSDKAAYELCLALAGDASHIKVEHFRISSYVIGIAALRAIEQSRDARALDLLFSDAFEHPWALIQNQCVPAAERITGQRWVKEGERVQMRAHADEIRAWWAANRNDFLAAHQDDWRQDRQPAP